MYALIAKCISLMYAFFSLLPKQNKVSFFSRQGKSGSLDFRMLSDALSDLCPRLVIRVCATDPESKNKVAFALSLPKMLYHAATSRVCVLEGYIPAISIPKIDSHTCVIQLWHAMGAIKKFGYQSLGTKAGRSEKAASSLGMHRNYDWIIAAGKGAIPAFAEAFGYDEARIVPFGMPRMDYILDDFDDSPRLKRAKQISADHPWLQSREGLKVLYVPTLRKGVDYSGWMTQEVRKLSEAFRGKDCKLIIAGHPLDDGCSKNELGSCENICFIENVSSIDLLEFADCVVTDYSAIAFEAGLLKKPVWFYVPDIEEYRVSPGLNIDPLNEFPDGSFVDPRFLSKAVIDACAQMKEGEKPEDAENGCRFGCDEFAAFMNRYFGIVREGYTAKLAIFIRECYRSSVTKTPRGR